MMKITVAASSPDSYVAHLSGWQLATVEQLRITVLTSAALNEVVKWDHIVYLSNEPVLLIRAEETRVLFGCWIGRRLLEMDPLLKPGGKYEMATREFYEGVGSTPPYRAVSSTRRYGLTRHLAIRRKL
jgi:hypothetical protein